MMPGQERARHSRDCKLFRLDRVCRGGGLDLILRAGKVSGQSPGFPIGLSSLKLSPSCPSHTGGTLTAHVSASPLSCFPLKLFRNNWQLLEVRTTV